MRAERQGTDLTLSVRDNGIGIAADKLPTIFEMFCQVREPLTRSKGGLGIGLYLAKQLVELHGGTLHAHSDGPGRGSEFVARLPIVGEQTNLDNAGDPDIQMTLLSGLRILVADDNHDAAFALTMLLKLADISVRTVHAGEEVVAAAREFRPHVVLCDIGMPRMNGYEVCRRIRLEPWGKDMILIAVSGWGQPEYRLQSEAAGFDRHLVKPVEPQALLRVLRELNIDDQPRAVTPR